MSMFNKQVSESSPADDLEALGLTELAEAIKHGKAVADPDYPRSDKRFEKTKNKDYPVAYYDEPGHAAPGAAPALEGDDEEGFDYDGVVEALNELAADYGVDEEDLPAFVEFLKTEAGIDVAELLSSASKTEGCDDDEDDEDDDEDDDEEEMGEAALAEMCGKCDMGHCPKCPHGKMCPHYSQGMSYEHLVAAAAEAVAEYVDCGLSEEEVEVSADEMATVAEALLVVGEALLDEGSKRAIAKRALRLARRKRKRLARMGKVKKSTLKAARKGQVAIGGGKFARAGAQAVKAFRQKLKKAGSAIMKRKWRKRIAAARKQTAKGVKARAMGKRMAASEEPGVGDALAEVESLIANLRGVVETDETADDDATEDESVIEDLRKVYENAATLVDALDKDLQENEAEEDDIRIVFREHLVGIANDAAKIAEMVADGEAEEADAAKDCEALAADFRDTVEAMKGVE